MHGARAQGDRACCRPTLAGVDHPRAPSSAASDDRAPAVRRIHQSPARAPLSVRRTVAESPRARTTAGSERRRGRQATSCGSARSIATCSMTFAGSSARKRRMPRLRRVRVRPPTRTARACRRAGSTILKTFPRRNALRPRPSMDVLLGGIGSVGAVGHAASDGRRARPRSAPMRSCRSASFSLACRVAYLLMFTAAGGQTVGKMLMGLRVVGDG